jgi:Rrf2 family protein
MKLSTRARYALRMMLDIGNHDENGRPVSLASVSKRTGLSRGYLEQLALALRNASLIRGISGRYGGYRLSRPPEAISVGDIVEATIGPVNVVDCLADPESCMKVADCECRMVYALINQRIAEVLKSYSLADMLNPKWSETMRGELESLAPLPSAGAPPPGTTPPSSGEGTPS